MKIYDKEITKEQAICLLKCRNSYFLKLPRQKYYPNYNFVKNFEKIINELDITYNPEELNQEDLERAVLDIVRNHNTKGSFYAATLLQDSAFPTMIFEKVINDSNDFYSRLAYMSTLPCASAQAMADTLANCGIPYYNLALIVNSKNRYDWTENLKRIYEYGTAAQLTYLAKNVSGINIEKVRDFTLESGDAKANYLFAHSINNTFGEEKGIEKVILMHKNRITDKYRPMKESTRNKLIAQHVRRIIDSESAEYNYKLTRGTILYGNPYIDKEKTLKTIYGIMLNSDDVEYITKYALFTKDVDQEKLLDRVSDIGTQEDVQYLEESIAFSNFFKQI